MTDTPEHGHRSYNDYTEFITKSDNPAIYSYGTNLEVLSGEACPQVINPHEHRSYNCSVTYIQKSSTNIKSYNTYVDVLYKKLEPIAIYGVQTEVIYGERRPQVVHPDHHRIYCPIVTAVAKRSHCIKSVGAYIEVMVRNFPVDPVTTINFIY